MRQLLAAGASAVIDKIVRRSLRAGCTSVAARRWSGCGRAAATQFRTDGALQFGRAIILRRGWQSDWAGPLILDFCEPSQISVRIFGSGTLLWWIWLLDCPSKSWWKGDCCRADGGLQRVR